MEHFFTFDKLGYVSKKKDGSCVFCSLFQRPQNEVELSVIEIERFTLLLNLYPYNPGHSMVIPKQHITDIRDLTIEDNIELISLRNYTVDMISEIYNPNGFNIGYNMGLPSGASIEHLHLHIIPRYPNEIGIAELLGGKRVLVEDPRKSCEKMKKWAADHPFSTRST